MRNNIVLGCAAVLLAGCAHTEVAPADAIPPYIQAAVDDPGRADGDRERDADRKPAEVIAFAGLKPGDKVADFIPGRGYFTKIFCRVVGSKGHVYAVSVPIIRPGNPPPRPADPPGGQCANVSVIALQAQGAEAAAETFAVPEPLDLIWTSENYHNPAFGSPDMLAVDKALFAALKPGGILIVEDHAAEAGSGARDTNTLHRIDPEQVRREVTAAGFVYAGESTVLRHADDPHTAKAHEMHDKTDRFLFKFRKP